VPLVAAAALVAAGLGSTTAGGTPPAAGAVFTGRLPDGAPLEDDSARAVEALAAQAGYTRDSTPVAGYYPRGYNTVIKESAFSVPVYTVGRDQPTSTVIWVDEDGTPQPPGAAHDLQSTFDEVPVPLDIPQLQADGSDGHLVVHQPSTDTLWEFWRFSASADGDERFTAGYGARIRPWSTSSGVLLHQWGARATSLDLLGGVMRMQDYGRGVFPYALTMALPVIDDRVVAPATRTDGPSAATPSQDMRHALSAGMKFRLPAGYDCDALREDGGAEERLLRMICVAARDYGIVVSDRSGGTVTMYAEDDRTVGTSYSEVETSPWPSVSRAFSGPDAVLPDFPWDDLQLLRAASPGDV